MVWMCCLVRQRIGISKEQRKITQFLTILPNDLIPSLFKSRVGEFPPYDARYMLRPETIESLFIAYRLTGDQRYRDHGWRIFQAIEKHCRVEGGGYATIINVDENPSRQEDKMETLFLVRYCLLWGGEKDLQD